MPLIEGFQRGRGWMVTNLWRPLRVGGKSYSDSDSRQVLMSVQRAPRPYIHMIMQMMRMETGHVATERRAAQHTAQPLTQLCARMHACEL